MKSPDEFIADFAFSFSMDAVPKSTVEHAKLVFLDTLGVCVRGAHNASVRRTASFLAPHQRSGSTLIGMKHKTIPNLAALINSSAGAYLELDEAHKTGGSHCAIQVIPACLAVGEIHNANGKDLLRAFIASYEIGDRLARLGRIAPNSFHSHGTWAVPAAATAAAMIMHLDRTSFIEAIRIASNLTVSPSSSASFQGASISNYYGGFASGNGVLAALLADSGIVGANGSLFDSLFPKLQSSLLSRAYPSIFQSLGKQYSLERNYVKSYCSCAWTHPAIEATLRILGKLDSLKIRRIDVYTYHNASCCKDQAPKNSIAARFSIPFVLANLIVHRRLDLGSFASTSFQDERVRRISKKIFVFESRNYTRKLPKWGAKVAVTFKGMKRIYSELEDAESLLQLPKGRDLLIQKFETLTEPLIGKKRAANVKDIVLNLDTLPKVQTLVKLLA